MFNPFLLVAVVVQLWTSFFLSRRATVNHVIFLVHTIQCVVILFHRVFLTWIDDTSIDEWLTVSASTSRSSGRIFCPFFMNQSLSLGGLKRSLTFLHYLGSALDYWGTQAIGDIYLVCRFSRMVSIRCLCIRRTFPLILGSLDTLLTIYALSLIPSSYFLVQAHLPSISYLSFFRESRRMQRWHPLVLQQVGFESHMKHLLVPTCLEQNVQ